MKEAYNIEEDDTQNDHINNQKRSTKKKMSLHSVQARLKQSSSPAKQSVFFQKGD